MTTIELHLDEETIERAQRIAASRAWTMEELFAASLDTLEVPPTEESESNSNGGEPSLDENESDTTLSPHDPLLGLFADIPELMDQIVEEAMQARERDRFRWSDDEIIT
jgi:hypothetical protein